MTQQQFLQDLEKKLWTSANKLLPSLDAAVYKYVVLGMVFVKYVSDAFETRRQEYNVEEIRTLQKTRDTILSKLLSGELDVSNINIKQKEK